MKLFAKILVTALVAFISASVVLAQMPDFTPKTPLIGAILHNDIDEAKRLLAAGADPKQGAFAGLPPISLAAVRGNLELVRAMTAKGAALDARDRTGATPLMWAAFNETGDSAMVKELLRLGADPAAANNAGETALTWALKRGETPVVAALREAGLSDTPAVREPAQRAILLLERSSMQFTKSSGCYSCHHQALPQMAFSVARTRGLKTDEVDARQQIDGAVRVLKAVSSQAVSNRDRIPDPPIGISYTLLAMAAENYAPDETTDAMTRVIAAWQSADGAFYPLPPMRPPSEASPVSSTALSLRALQLYGKDVEEKIARARDWLTAVDPQNTEDHAMRLLGLVWSTAGRPVIQRSAALLLAQQRPDGGWAQLPNLESDAYATGQALVALHDSGVAVSSAAYRRGIGFLLRTQFPDGSWLVRSRAFPVQPLLDSGFPHGKNQWISAAGTSWASMALSLALPALEPEDAPSH